MRTSVGTLFPDGLTSYARTEASAASDDIHRQGRRAWTKEEWMQYFIGDPPLPAPGHFEEPGSWEQ